LESHISFKIRRSGHILDLEKITSHSPIQVSPVILSQSQITLKYKTFELEITGDDVAADNIITILRNQYQLCTFGFPPSALILDVQPPERYFFFI
jgi:hypothetical protein